MKCTSCQGEWTPPKNISLSKCPFCQADVLPMLNKHAELLSTEVILSNMLNVYGSGLLQNPQRLSAMISDLFSHDPKIKRLLLLSVQEMIPQQLIAIESHDILTRSTQTHVMMQRLAEEAFLKEGVAKQIVVFWTNAFGWEGPDNDESVKIVWRHGYCGIREGNGIMITDYIYDDAWFLSERFIRVCKLDNYGIIDSSGNEIIPIIYSGIYNFTEGLFGVRLDKKYGFLNKSGNLVIDFEYDEVGDYINGICKVKKENKMGYIDKNGRVVIPFIFDDIKDFENGIAEVMIKR